MRCISASVFCLVAALPAFAQGAAPEFITATLPVYGHVVRFSAPTAYQPAFQKDNGGRFFIFEMVPKGEKVEAWTGMVTITGIPGARGPAPAHAAYAQKFSEGYRRNCPQTFATRPLDVRLPGTPEMMAFYLSCGHVAAPGQAPRSESVIVAIMQGERGLYTFQWAERGAAQQGPIPFDATKWAKRVAAMKAVRLCLRKEGEQAPYPSCQAQP